MPVPKISFPGRLAYVAVSGTVNNKNQFRQYGAVSALRSDQNRELTKNLDPNLKEDGSLVSAEMDGAIPVPKVKYEYDPKVKWSGTNEYTDLTTGTIVAQPLTAEFALDKVRQPDPILIPAYVWRVLEQEAEKYRDQLLDDDPVEVGKAMTKIQAISSLQEVGRVIRKTIESSFFVPIETVAVNSLVTNAGKNPLYPDLDPGEAATIKLMNADDSVTVKLEDDLSNLTALTQATGPWIVLAGTGSRVRTYFNRVLKSGLNAAGIQLGEQIKEGGVEFHTSMFIDAILGPNHFFVMAPGSAALVSQQELRHYDGQTVDGYTYSTLSMPAFDLAMDLRLRESSHNKRKNAANADVVDPHPQIVMAPSLRYNIWTKPQGFHYADNTDPLYAVNGIYHYIAE
ncbi:hypothetical protein BWI93_05425 [Siphonobacter sp. BAB-5385]|uniref:hypothetical protein n=1 Tax=Siphonobacter sp. BAB-5385 TaxID=1864822 RepID=UPI000B9ECEB0|nr:hypothetical protein [Siphonobacter sp. BAB-5385]OZI09188.1 hypothetical protein BWI93_05425 [Siphonobacter sp. BAB-5385]